MKKVIIVLVIFSALIFIGAGYYGSSSSNTPAPNSQIESVVSENQVIIQNFSFNPAILNIKIEDTVTWVNKDSAPHTIKSDTFNSGNLGADDAFSFTFDKDGAYDYICGIHPSMKGKIVVQ